MYASTETLHFISSFGGRMFTAPAARNIHTPASVTTMEKQVMSAAQKAQKVQSANWKEEVILNKQLDTLESLRRQVVSSITLDQRATYNRFHLKLQRSELASARLLGHRQRHSELRQAAARRFERHKDDGDAQTAINALLQRPVSAPAMTSTARQPRVNSTPRTPSLMTGPRPPVSAQLPEACHRKEDTQPLPPALVERSGKSAGRIQRARPGTAAPSAVARVRLSYCKMRRSASSANMDTLNCTVPHSSLTARVTSVKFSTTDTPEGELSGHDSASQQFQNMRREYKATASGFSTINETLGITSTEVKQKMPLSQTVGSQSKASVQESSGGNMGVAMCVFLQNVKPTGTSPTEEALKWLRQRQDIEKEKLRAFAERLQPLQAPQEPIGDYETAWIHESNSRRAGKCITLDPEEDLSKWMVVGKKINSRSLTIPALGHSLSPTDFPAEMLFLECYNAVLTRENLEERKWFNNDPSTLVK